MPQKTASPPAHSVPFRAIAKSAILFCSLGLAGFALAYAHEQSLFDASFVDRFITNKGFSGILLFFALVALFSSIGFPRQILATLGGYAFGAWQGAALVNLGLAAGCALSFFYARLLAQKSLRRRLSQKIVSMETALVQKPFLAALCIRLLPVGNNTLTSMLGGISSIAPLPFLAGSFVGYLPQTFVFAFLGQGVALDGGFSLAFSVVLFCLAVGLGLWIWRKGLTPPTSH